MILLAAKLATLPAGAGVIIAQVEQQTQTPAAPTDWVQYLLQGGPFAIVLLLIIFDKIGTHAERDRLRVENENLRTKNDELNTVLREDVVPPLTELNRLMTDVVKRLDEDRDPLPRRR